jgi:hypothetical protein
MCAMSATRIAPTSCAIDAKPAKSMVRGMAVPPHHKSLGRSRLAMARTSSRSMRPVPFCTPYATERKNLPVMLTFQPCVRWPPAGRPMPMMVSPGAQNARYTARFAGEPEYGCTLAWSTAKSALARAIASDSI